MKIRLQADADLKHAIVNGRYSAAARLWISGAAEIVPLKDSTTEVVASAEDELVFR